MRDQKSWILFWSGECSTRNHASNERITGAETWSWFASVFGLITSILHLLMTWQKKQKYADWDHLTSTGSLQRGNARQNKTTTFSTNEAQCTLMINFENIFHQLRRSMRTPKSIWTTWLFGWGSKRISEIKRDYWFHPWLSDSSLKLSLIP